MVLVTGGSGYFGSRLVQRLVECKETVRVFDLHGAEDRPNGVDFFQGDIRDLEAIRRACCQVQTVFHNVAMVPLCKKREQLWSVNRDGTENLLKAALKAGVRKVVYTSSSAVFGIPKGNPITPETLPQPLEAYGASKLAGERLCHAYAQKGLEVTIVRPRTILGQGRLGLFQFLFERVYQGRKIFVLGNGDNRFSFIHVADLADACLRAARRRGFSVYNIGTEDFCTMRQTLEALIRHAGSRSRVCGFPRALGEVLMNLTGYLRLSPFAPYHALAFGREIFFDVTKAKQELGWKPRWGNIGMICQSYDWYLAHRDEVLRRKGASYHKSAVGLGIWRWLA